MFDWSTLAAFILAAFILIVIPGPAVLFVIARALEQGKMAGIVSVLGISLGALVHTAAAALGISALFAASALAFNVVKYLGAAYLIYLGVVTLRQKPKQTDITIEKQSLWKIFRQGAMVNILNPKSALFYLAFLPQFTDPTRGEIWLQMIILGLIFVVVALISDGVYALVAGQLSDWLKNNETFKKRQKQVSGVTYIALGLVAAVSGGDSK